MSLDVLAITTDRSEELILVSFILMRVCCCSLGTLFVCYVSCLAVVFVAFCLTSTGVARSAFVSLFYICTYVIVRLLFPLLKLKDYVLLL